MAKGFLDFRLDQISATRVSNRNVSSHGQAQNEKPADGSHQARHGFDKITGRKWLTVPVVRRWPTCNNIVQPQAIAHLTLAPLPGMGDQSQPGVERRIPCY
jgi:hypothetical protein